MQSRKRIVVIGLAVAAVGVTAAGAAFAVRGWHGGFAKRIYEKVKSELSLTAEQATKVDALRDRVIGHFKSKKADHQALFAEAKALWLEDSLDDAKVDALIAKIHQRRAQAHQLIRSTVKDLHGILTKEQRQKLVTLIEKFRSKMKARWGKKHKL